MWYKKFRKKKFQTLIIFVMLVACTLLMAGSLGIFTSLIEPYKEFVKETNAPAIRAIMYEDQQEIEQQTMQKFLKLDKVEDVVPIVRHMAEEKVTVHNKVVEDTIALVEYKEEEFGSIRMLKGKNEVPKETECMVSQALARSNDIRVGDTMHFTTEANDYAYTVVGIYTAPYSCNILYQSEVLVMQIPEQLTRFTTYCIYGKSGVTGQEIVDDYVTANNGIMDGRFDTLEEVVNNITLNEKILGGMLLALSLIVFLVCIIMIRFLLKNALLQDKKTIAIYKTIGYKERDIVTMYMKFYMSIAVVATLVGASLSPILASSFIKPAFENIGVQDTTVSWWPRIVVIVGVLLLIALQVSVTVSKWKKIKPVVVLMERENGLGVKKRKISAKGDNLSFSPLMMAIRMIQRHRKSTFYVIITCFLSIYMVNFAIVSYSNVKTMKQNNYYWLGFDNHDISLITLNQDKFAQTCKEIETLPEVKRIIKNRFDFHASIKWEKGVSNPNIEVMVYETYEGLDLPVIEGRNPEYSDEIVIGNLLAKELNKKVGDYIDIYFGTDKKASLLIVGTFQSFMNMGRSIRILGDTLEEAKVPFSYTDASVYLHDKSSMSQAEVNKQFINKYSDVYAKQVKIIERSDKYSNMLGEIRDPQMAAIGPFIVVVLIIGSMNLISIIYLQNVSNRKTYAIYKSIGYRTSHLLKMNICYVGIIAMVSMIFAIPIFVVAYPVIMTLCMSMFGFDKYPVFFNVIHMVIGNIGLLGIFIISVLATSKSLHGNKLSELSIE